LKIARGLKNEGLGKGLKIIKELMMGDVGRDCGGWVSVKWEEAGREGLRVLRTFL
jgi:hypothetical protein